MHAACDADHWNGAPPGLTFVGAGAWERCGEKEAAACADGGPASGLAEIVDAGPEELAGVFGVVAHGDPLIAVVSVFGADNFTSWFVGVGLEDLLLAIVLAHHVEEIGEAVVVVVRDVGAEERLCDGARGIVGVCGGYKLFEDGDGDFGLWCVVNLVADGVEDDAGVVAITLDGGGFITLGPVTKIEMVVVGIFGDGPAVEHLVHDEEAHAVGEIEELGCGWVCRRGL